VYVCVFFSLHPNKYRWHIGPCLLANITMLAFPLSPKGAEHEGGASAGAGPKEKEEGEEEEGAAGDEMKRELHRELQTAAIMGERGGSMRCVRGGKSRWELSVRYGDVVFGGSSLCVVASSSSPHRYPPTTNNHQPTNQPTTNQGMGGRDGAGGQGGGAHAGPHQQPQH
jgi:hypothetical protein